MGEMIMFNLPHLLSRQWNSRRCQLPRLEWCLVSTQGAPSLLQPIQRVNMIQVYHYLSTQPLQVLYSQGNFCQGLY